MVLCFLIRDGSAGSGTLEESELVLERSRVPVQVCEFPVEFSQGELRREERMEEVEEVVVGADELVLVSSMRSVPGRVSTGKPMISRSSR